MTYPVRYEKHGTIGLITVENPPVNALTVGVPQGILDGLAAGLNDPDIAALVLVGGGRTFISGADINEFLNPPPPGNATIFDVIDAFEHATKPVIASIHGNALGGGLEVAMGCHYRCGVKGSRYGLPEVKLGLVPGAGGTQRLPRLIGTEAALPLIVSGDFVDAEKALSLGIIDQMVDDVVAGGLAFAETVVAEGRPLRKVRDMRAEPPADREYFKKFEASIARKARGYLAPFMIIECVKVAVEQPFIDGLIKERALFQRCYDSPQSKGLIHLFFAERTANKIPDVPRDTPVQAVDAAAVIGAGTMGGGIAMCFANAGIPVTLIEAGQEALDRGLETIQKNYAATVAKGRLSRDRMDQRMALISPALDYQAVKDADIVIEAVFEEMDIKREVFQALDQHAKDGAILASNTSTLDVNEIAAVTKRPEAVIGTHFFSPANVMALLEVVRGEKTDKTTIASVMKLAKRIGKVPVLVGVCDGFVGNRMLAMYLRQAHQMIEEGARPEQIDKVLYDYGMAMGPFTMADMAGLDVGWRIRKRRKAEGTGIEDNAPIEDQLCEMGRFGQKTGAGWYRYEAGDRTPQPDPEVEALIRKYIADKGVKPRNISDQEILERCLYQLVNEGAKILEEGIALRASDIDVIYANGYGFPRYRGGPMKYADMVGVKEVYAAVCRYHEQFGDAWKPAPLLKQLAEDGGNFNDR